MTNKIIDSYKGYIIDYVYNNVYISSVDNYEHFFTVVPKMEGKTLEECAKDYINQLEDKNE